jgi:protein-tyrosine kinase
VDVLLENEWESPMSRVDEAVRRRAGNAPVAELEAPDANALALALFTEDLETAPAVRVDSPAAVEQTAPSAAVAQPPGTDAAVATPAAAVKESLFQRIDSHLAEKVVIDTKMLPVSREQYRKLGATLHHGQTAHGLRVILVTSALPNEGKTLTSSNLAMTLSESYKRRVLLIDADLRRPTLHTVFGTDNTSGLGDGLTSVDEVKMPIRQLSPYLALLPAGRPSSDPMAGLTSDRMRRLLEEAREAFDWVILDTPPVGLLPDARLLGSMVDGAILVIKAGGTPHDLARRACDALGKDKILGVVLNRAEESSGPGSSYYAYDYGAPAPVSDKPAI